MASKLQDAETKQVIAVDTFSLQKWSPVASEIHREEFLGISFSHHMEILHKTKDIQEVLFYIHQAVLHQWNKYTLRDALKANLYSRQDSIPSNFIQTIPDKQQALRTIQMFKDEYLLDYLNVEDIDAAYEDVDERAVEQEIVRNAEMQTNRS